MEGKAFNTFQILVHVRYLRMSHAPGGGGVGDYLVYPLGFTSACRCHDKSISHEKNPIYFSERP